MRRGMNNTRFGDRFYMEEEPPNAGGFCKDCKNLSPTEEEQDKITKLTGNLENHFCSKYKMYVLHFGHHPHICKCNQCLESGKDVLVSDFINERSMTLVTQVQDGDFAFIFGGLFYHFWGMTKLKGWRKW